MSVSRRQRPAPISGPLVRTAPPPPARSPAAIARAAATGSAGSRLGAATGAHGSHRGSSVVAFPPPADVAARVPITSAPMSIARVGLGDFGGGMQMPALPQIPQAPGMPQIPQAPQMPQMPQLPALPQLGGGGGGGGGDRATSSSSDSSPTDQLRRQFKLDREQLGQVIDDLP